jgi:hypothetical protein
MVVKNNWGIEHPAAREGQGVQYGLQPLELFNLACSEFKPTNHVPLFLVQMCKQSMMNMYMWTTTWSIGALAEAWCADETVTWAGIVRTVDSLAWLWMYSSSLYKVHTQLLYTHALVHMQLLFFLQIHSISYPTLLNCASLAPGEQEASVHSTLHLQACLWMVFRFHPPANTWIRPISIRQCQ